MPTESTEFSKATKAGTAFLLCWQAGFVISSVWSSYGISSGLKMPGNRLLVFIGNQIFFYPQNVLPCGLMKSDAAGQSYEILSTPVGMILGFLFWLIVGVAFAWLTRRLRLYYTFPLAVTTIFVVLMAAVLFLGLFGIRIPVDGP
ncbi:MAG TPA: hypothetical protein VGO57_14135 [Verrucomicrobiae bacterium]|jgi:hypothetical protein